MKTKYFQHNFQDVNRMFLLQEKYIEFGAEIIPDILLQLFKIYESCPPPEFQESIGEVRKKFNSRDDLIAKECLMAETLSSYSKLIFEKSGSHKTPSP